MDSKVAKEQIKELKDKLLILEMQSEEIKSQIHFIKKKCLHNGEKRVEKVDYEAFDCLTTFCEDCGQVIGREFVDRPTPIIGRG